MKPHRLTLTNSLVLGYGLHRHLDLFLDPRPASREELEMYHDPKYLNLLEVKTRAAVEPPATSPLSRRREGGTVSHLQRKSAGDWNITNSNPFEQAIFTEDCPVFGGMNDFFCQYTGASLAGARSLVSGQSDIAINWSGGLHHAKKAEPSGFCYVNDIVLAILEMLRYHPRVLYIDIDIHHGDGVEQAFYHSNRVFTVSLHKYNGSFFPGTGKLEDIGSGQGKYFCANIPLEDGIDDAAYLSIFREVIGDIITMFKPSSIVLQCGADSLGCDKLGCFNLSIKAHGDCVRFIKNFNLPLLILGGGGYTIDNVARCWTYETAVLTGTDIPDQLPRGPYYSYFAPDYKLHKVWDKKWDNENEAPRLRNMVANIRSKLRYLHGAPSVVMGEEGFPVNLKEWLEQEEKRIRDGEEIEEEGDDEYMKDVRKEDRHFGKGQFFQDDNDNRGEVTGEKDPDVEVRDGDGRRRARGGARRGAGVVEEDEGEGAELQAAEQLHQALAILML
ncbi:5077_t:CDS:2 [Acaulospora colombiana]|uniref:5077_t:CDS:1 n=1 Tax=Acaulospora colombiana TaxID=27376 RepID=A0ACA9NT72_9GLOM|nr:5077_t:CDS:2 [Acaulospora colombiana]